MNTDYDELRLKVLNHPDDVEARVALAYHCDAHRTEEEAIKHYDHAWKLGVSEAERASFMVGYGSTLKNVGRLAESEQILRRAVEENPTNQALRVFLSLTLHAAGRTNEAMATLLELVTQPRDESVTAYAKAISHYARELRP